MAGFRAHVNLIPYNPIESADHQTPSRQRVIEFLQILRDRHVIAHLRETRGDDVNAACGQLRAVSSQLPEAVITPMRQTPSIKIGDC